MVAYSEVMACLRGIEGTASTDFEHSHHPVILMIEDMAVEHPLPGIVVVADDEPDGLVLRNVDDVLPAPERLGNAVPVDDLELEAMQVKRMVHPDEVLHLPDLGGAERCLDIHPLHVHH